MITHSFIMAVVESYAMSKRQIRWLAQILPDNWELIFVDDGSDPPIEVPNETPKTFHLIRTREVRRPGEWTQKAAINRAVAEARGTYFVKSDVDHIFTREAIEAANSFTGDMLLFTRKAGLFDDNFNLKAFPEHEVYSPVDDIYVIRKDLFISLGGYPVTRRYGGAGKFLWPYSRGSKPSPALVYVMPDTHETYHSLERVED